MPSIRAGVDSASKGFEMDEGAANGEEERVLWFCVGRLCLVIRFVTGKMIVILLLLF